MNVYYTRAKLFCCVALAVPCALLACSNSPRTFSTRGNGGADAGGGTGDAWGVQAGSPGSAGSNRGTAGQGGAGGNGDVSIGGAAGGSPAASAGEGPTGSAGEGPAASAGAGPAGSAGAGPAGGAGGGAEGGEPGAAGGAGVVQGGAGGAAGIGGAAQGGTGGEPEPTSYDVTLPSVAELAVQSSTTLEIELSNISGTVGEVEVTVEGLPDGVTASALSLSSSNPLGALELAANVLATPAEEIELTITFDGPGDSDMTATVLLSIVGRPGTVDLGFGTNGVVTHTYAATDQLLDARVLENGSVVVGRYSNMTAMVTRHLHTGVIDTSFGNNGIVFRAASPGDRATFFDFAAHSDGSSVFAIRFGSNMNGFDRGLFAFTAAGAWDAEFADNGWLLMGSGMSELASLGPIGNQPDGRILVYDGGAAAFWIRRRLADGAQDPEWVGGVNVYGLAPTEYAVDDAGNVYAGGGYGGFAVTRFTASGTEDASWGALDPGAELRLGTVPFADATAEVGGLLPTSNRVYVVGTVLPNDTSIGYASAAGFAALTSSGQADSTFGSSGGAAELLRASTDAQQTSGSALMLHDGSILVMGVSTTTGTLTVFVAKYTLDGALDSDFASGGVGSIPIGSGEGRGLAMGIQPNGRLLAVVAAGNELRMARFWL